MIKIFVSAYACEPNSGSEIGVGWHWVLEMSKYFELWVLTRTSNQKTIESWLNSHAEYTSIHFLYYDWPKWLRFWKKGLRGVRIYYNLWQLSTNRLVKATMQENDISIYHLLTYGNALWPASRYGQQQFFIWGPIGGVDTIPKEFSQYYGFRWRIIEWIRRIVVKCLAVNPSYLKRCERANLILCKSESIYEAIPDKYRSKAVLFTDVAVDYVQYEKNYNNGRHDGITRFLMVGRLDAWRGFDLAIESMAIASTFTSGIHLDIVGSGSDRKRILRWIEKYRMNDCVTLHGQVTRALYYQMMADCDAVLNPSLKEGAVTTAFDSMAFGKPLVCIDTKGYTRYFQKDYAIVIEKGNRKDMIATIADSIVRLTDKGIREEMGNKAKAAGYAFGWDAKGEEIYRMIVGKYKRNDQ